VKEGIDMRPIIPVLMFLALPILEIVTFIYVGSAIGVLKTVLLVIAAAVLGVAVLRYQGLSALRKINRDIQTGQAPEAGIANGFLVAIAGFLLIVPGFITDIIGLALLLPPVRRLVWGFVSRNMVVSYNYAGGFRRGKRREDFVDLSPDDYRRDDDEPNDRPGNNPRLDRHK
jgi:UPF0716 protein FxsA